MKRNQRTNYESSSELLNTLLTFSITYKRGKFSTEKIKRRQSREVFVIYGNLPFNNFVDALAIKHIKCKDFKTCRAEN